MTTLVKGNFLAATGASNQMAAVSVGANNRAVIYDSTQTTGFNSAAFAGAPVPTQEVYVSLQGNDTTGDGSVINPWLTFAHAQASITPTVTSRYAIWLTPGFYSENLSLNANVFICATAPVETRLIGNININNASWNTPGVDNRSGLVNIEHRTGTAIFDFTAQAGNDNGKLFFLGVRFSDQPVLTGQSTAQANQIVFKNCYFFSGVRNVGTVCQISNSLNNGGSYDNVSSALSGVGSDLEIDGGANDGNYTNTWTSNGNCTLEIQGCGFSSTTTLLTSGANATTTINRGSLPDNSKITTTASGTLVVNGGLLTGTNRSYVSRATPAFSTSYTPSTTNDTQVAVICTYTNTGVQTSAVSITVNSVTILKQSDASIVSSNEICFSFVVPVGQSYQVVNSGSGSQTLNTIYELLL